MLPVIILHMKSGDARASAADGSRRSICCWCAHRAAATVRPKSDRAMAKPFSRLTEQETLALAIALEEEDSHIYADFAERFRAAFPSTAATLERMQHEESEHRQRLIDGYRSRFGEHLPLIQRSDVRVIVKLPPVWLMKALTVSQVRRQIGVMEYASRRFFEVAASRSTDAGTGKLLGDHG